MAQTELHRRLYDDWVRLYAPEMFRYAYRLTGNRQIAEDILQETFLEAWRAIEKQRDAARARGWLFQILRHRYAHFLRDTRRHRQTLSLEADSSVLPSGSFVTPLDKLAEQDSLQAALGSLSPILRQTFLMVFMEGLTCRETAQSLNIPLGTVLSRLDSGRRALRTALRSEHRPRNSNGHRDKGKDFTADTRIL
jgi:RNA polymerase sigma-70 factor, ECF subfamily